MKFSRRVFGTAFGLLMAAAIALSAAAQSNLQVIAGESVIETIKERGVIRIGLSIFKPWSMPSLNGEMIGFEVDVGRKLAEDMGVEVEFIQTAWDGIIPALISGEFDVIISGMSITPQRNLTINFSDPYAYSGLAILSNKSMTEGFSIEDYNNADVTFAARRGTTPATVIANMFPEAQLLLFDEDGASIQEVLNGNAHATMAPEPRPSTEARRYSKTLHVPFTRTFDARGEAFAHRKGDPDATNYFNNWIQAHWRIGWLQERNDYWFRGNDWADQVAAE